MHLHIEGTFEPEQMLEIAARNNMLDSLPFKDLAAAKLAYQFKDLQSFLDIYYAGCAVLLHEKVPKKLRIDFADSVTFCLFHTTHLTGVN